MGRTKRKVIWSGLQAVHCCVSLGRGRTCAPNAYAYGSRRRRSVYASVSHHLRNGLTYYLSCIVSESFFQMQSSMNESREDGEIDIESWVYDHKIILPHCVQAGKYPSLPVQYAFLDLGEKDISKTD